MHDDVKHFKSVAYAEFERGNSAHLPSQGKCEIGFQQFTFPWVSPCTDLSANLKGRITSYVDCRRQNPGLRFRS